MHRAGTSESERPTPVRAVYLKDYQSVSELVEALKVYFAFYNHERPNQSHGWATPGQVYQGDQRRCVAA